MTKLYIDAATKGNPGPSGAGVLIVHQKQRWQFHHPLPELSNHQAEFQALMTGLKDLEHLDLPKEMLVIYSDSKLVIESLDKAYAKHYQSEVDQILKLENSYPLVLHQWISDRQNKGAHTLAQQALRD